MCKYARIAAVALAGAAVPVALAFAVAVAHAGEYHVYSCRTPSGQVAPVDGWRAAEHSGEDSTADACEESDGGLVAGLNAHVAHPADTDKATWGFEAPPGETITGATLWRAGETVALAKPETAYIFWLAGVADAGPQTEVFEECGAKKCPNEGGFTEPLSSENRVSVPQGALGSRYLYLNVSCASLVTACSAVEAGKAGYAATIELFAADLVLSQSEGPTVSAVGGSLAQAPTVSGTSDVAFEARDAGSGVYEVVFRVDGEIVSAVVPETAGGRCHDVGGTTDGLPAFLYTQPCPAALSVDLPFDTTGLANGPHDLLVSVLDAAGNSATVVDRTITVANPTNAPGVPSGNGSNGTANDAGTGAAGTAGQGAAGALVAAPGPANGTNAAAQATLTAAWKGARSSDAYGAARTVAGRLTGPGGAPIADAQIEVSELPTYSGAQARALPTPRTGPTGGWSLVLPRGISSCQLRFAYRSHLGDTVPAATRTLSLSVHAGLALKIAPRVARAGGTIRFAGRLLGGPVPVGGKQLVLEARSPGGRWLEFHVVRAGAHDSGRFHFAYRFRLPGPVRYQFRVLSEAEADYPFATGSSNVVRVYER